MTDMQIQDELSLLRSAKLSSLPRDSKGRLSIWDRELCSHLVKVSLATCILAMPENLNQLNVSCASTHQS